KADPRISEEYDDRLVPEELKHFGAALRAELKEAIALLLEINGQETIMESDPQGRESMNIRAAYLEPLHYLQIELLSRIRQLDEDEHDANLDKAMMVAISGIAIGMRNTG
ncbi:MAG: phosphoenolpyruvate carboxylase, partial [Pseudomonadota bacterium]|nr:phosphoenolpyruvate carboxylase [Pseudomonadota bacterium]